MSENLIFLENKGYDLSSMVQINFSLSSNFEILQKAIEHLIKNQNESTNRIRGLEDTLHSNDRKITDLEKEVSGLRRQISIQKTELEKEIKKDINLNVSSVITTIEPKQIKNEIIQTNDEESNFKETEGKIQNDDVRKISIPIRIEHKINENDTLDEKKKETLQLTFEGEELKNQIQNKIEENQNEDRNSIIRNQDFNGRSSMYSPSRLPRDTEDLSLNFRSEILKISIKLNNFEDKLSDITFIKQELQNLKSNLAKINNEIKDKGDIVSNLTKEMKTSEDKINEITIKLMDFDIFDAIKTKSTKSNEPINSNDIVHLVQNMERKILKKFEFYDDLNKKLNDEIYKNKNEIMNSNINIEANKESIKETQNTIENIQEEINKLNRNQVATNENLQHFHEKFDIINEDIENIKMEIKESKFEVHEQIKSIESDENDPQKKSTEHDEKNLRDFKSRLNNVEKSLKLFINSYNAPQQIEKIFSELKNKAELADFIQFRDLASSLERQIFVIKDNFGQIFEEKNLLQDIMAIKRKVEMLLNQNSKVKSEENSAKITGFEIGKFLEVNEFKEFMRLYQLEIKDMKKIQEDHKIKFHDIDNELKHYARDTNLKIMEQMFDNKILDLKLFTLKKFSDKNETNKNIKFLDTQLKNFTDIYIKKMDKGDNWLLAKKPLGGFNCASCEAYLGDLHDNSQYIPWNKVEKNSDRLYRAGNGFSRLLYSLNVDGTKSRESSEEKLKDENNGKVKRLKLKGRNDNLNTNIMKSNDSDLLVSHLDVKIDSSDLNMPKIVKIYRKKMKVVEQRNHSFTNENELKSTELK